METAMWMVGTAGFAPTTPWAQTRRAAVALRPEKSAKGELHAVAARAGFGPATSRLTGGRSTTELPCKSNVVGGVGMTHAGCTTLRSSRRAAKMVVRNFCCQSRGPRVIASDGGAGRTRTSHAHLRGGFTGHLRHSSRPLQNEEAACSACRRPLIAHARAMGRAYTEPSNW